MSLAMGPITRLRTRALYAVLNSRSSWADKCYLPAEAREELEFWQTNVQFLNGRSIWFSSGTTRVVHSDASSTGYEIPVTVGTNWRASSKRKLGPTSWSWGESSIFCDWETGRCRCTKKALFPYTVYTKIGAPEQSRCDVTFNLRPHQNFHRLCTTSPLELGAHLQLLKVSIAIVE